MGDASAVAFAANNRDDEGERMAALVLNGSASRSSGAEGGFSVSRGREARDISFIPAGVDGGCGASLVFRFGVEGGAASSSLVVLRFRDFGGGDAGSAGSAGSAGDSFVGRAAEAELRRLERRVAIVRRGVVNVVRWWTRCITLWDEVRRLGTRDCVSEKDTKGRDLV